jgi:hypothetical protein
MSSTFLKTFDDDFHFQNVETAKKNKTKKPDEKKLNG